MKVALTDSAAKRLAWICLAAAVLLAAGRRLSDPDLPWHLAVGRAAAAARATIKADAWSYTFAGRPVPYEYASDLALYAVQRWAGFPGLHLLAAFAIGAMAWTLARDPRADPAVGLAGSALAVAAVSPFFILRPALFSFTFFALVLWILNKHRQKERSCWLWLLVPVQLLWANVHGFAILGAATAWVYAVSKPSRKAFAASLAATLATYLSPFGPGIFMGPWQVRALSRSMAEWAPASWDLFIRYDPALGLLCVLALAALLWGRETDGSRRPPLFDLLLLAGAAILMLARFRLAPFFAIIAAPFAVQRLRPLVQSRGWLPTAALACGLLAPAAVAARGEVPWGVGFDPGRLPEGAARFIAQALPQGPVYNDVAFGGYLIWRLQPGVPVFVDGRSARLYPPDFIIEARSAMYDPAAFSRLESRHGFQWAVVNAWPGSAAGLPLAASSDWAMVYLDESAAVYVKTDGPNRLSAGQGYQGLRHLTPWPLLLEERIPRKALEHDAALALSQAPDSPRALFWAAAAALRRGDAPLARLRRERIARLASGNPGLPLLDRMLRLAEARGPAEIPIPKAATAIW